MRKSLLCLLCGGMLFFSPVTAGAAITHEAKIVINNAPVVIPGGDQPAIILNGRTYVPLRVISEHLGTQVQWLPETKQVVIATANNLTLTVPERPGKQKDVQIVIDGKALQVSPQLGQTFITAMNRTVVPFRVVGEALGCEVSWQQSSRTVEIKTKPATPEPPVQQPADSTPQPSPADIALLQELAGYKTNLRLMDKTFINSEELLKMDPASFSAEQRQLFKQYRDQLSKYDAKIKLPGGTVINTADVTIMGPSVATADQLRAWIAAETPRIRAKMEQKLKREFIPIPDLAELYIKIGAEYGVRGDLAFAQAAKETHYWQFTGDVQPWQNNFCGLWATGSPCTGQESLNGADPTQVRFEPGVHGAIFVTPEAGVEAHIQHLYAYATKDPLPPGKVLVDPRYTMVRRGTAPTWQQLNARWAVPGTTYGQSIIHDYWKAALAK
ncbi:copper amine oxidase [Desulforamulus profundi]|uniref:Copper amine oxidase n=2 Tax=Desulforamulus profundi TaxID=1383067 RepID=A0A2C6MFF6_9FIRM|nr:copper amine oxidase [Desulforamulus profundi]